MNRVPVFPVELRHRLAVQSMDRATGTWSEPRPALIEHLIAAIHELGGEDQAAVVRGLGLVPKDVGDRLARAEWVFDALSDAQQAIDRFREYRKQFPEKRDGDVIDAEFPEVPSREDVF
jgi:hypothetical protein